MRDDATTARVARSLTGYNNDVVRGDKSYHVLTEDLGDAHAVVVTQTFSGGSIIATLRSNYPDIADPVERRTAVRRMMQEQHKAAMRELVPRREPSRAPHGVASAVARSTPGLGVPVVGHESTALLVRTEHAAVLEVLSGPFAHERLALCATPVSLGPAGALSLDGPSMEPLEALFIRRSTAWTIVANPAGAQVRVNDAPITGTRLTHGDRIDIGVTALLFLEEQSLDRVVRTRSADEARPRSRLRPTLLPLVLAERSTPRSLIESPHALEQALAALAHIGPTSTPQLFEDRESRLAYHLDAFIALAKLTLLGAEDAVSGLRRTLDGRSVGLMELDRLVCEQADSRLFAAVARALRSVDEVTFTADELNDQLDASMEAMVNDPAQLHVDPELRQVVLTASAWPFLGRLEEEADGSAIARLRAFGGPRRTAELRAAAQQSYDLVFMR